MVPNFTKVSPLCPNMIIVIVISILFLTLAQLNSTQPAKANRFASLRHQLPSGEHRWSREISSKQHNDNYIHSISSSSSGSSSNINNVELASSNTADNQLPVIPPVVLASTPQEHNPQQDLDNHIHGDHINSLQSSQVSPTSAYTFGPQQNIFSNNSIASDGVNKKGTTAIHHQNLNKLQRYLNERQQELIKRNPGSLLAVARALKMTIVECQHQMRHEPWDCPIYGFSIKPTDIFGKLMSRSFKETSFIHSLLSSAIAHSIARACTENLITTCGQKRTRDGGYREDIEFGRQFAQQFMEATHELSAQPFASSSSTNNIDRHLNNNIIITGSGAGNGGEPTMHHQQQQQATATSGLMEPNRRERKIRNMINEHNDEVGRLHVLNGMRRECKCHGLSGACNIQTCWLKLPPFREVASKLHDSLDQAIRVIYVAHNPTNRQKSLTSATVKKSNKKRSSVQPVNGLTRSSTSSSSPQITNLNSNSHPYPYASSNSLISDTPSIIGSRQRGTKRHTNSDNCENCYRTPVVSTSGTTQAAQEPTSVGDQSTRDSVPTILTNTTVLKRRPVARSIGIAASTISPSKFDLLYYEESPDFCVANERYNIKGTKGRICSENLNASNSCERLCCGRGYKTEVREEKYKCECQFKFCCKLDCNTCTRRKVIHKCL